MKHTTAIFRQVNKQRVAAHHDALEFPDGQVVLLTFLCEGQQATVLQLPAEPKTPRELESQKRAAYVARHVSSKVAFVTRRPATCAAKKKGTGAPAGPFDARRLCALPMGSVTAVKTLGERTVRGRYRLRNLCSTSLNFSSSLKPAAKLGPYVLRSMRISVLPCLRLISPLLSRVGYQSPFEVSNVPRVKTLRSR
jgi:hypothetical protein